MPGLFSRRPYGPWNAAGYAVNGYVLGISSALTRVFSVGRVVRADQTYLSRFLPADTRWIIPAAMGP